MSDGAIGAGVNNKSQQLYDAGEEAWPVKLHVACGGIRLRGYKNIDVVGHSAVTAPTLARLNETDISDYYARLDLDSKHRRPNVVDQIGMMQALPYTRETVNKIVCIQGLEHLSPLTALRVLHYWHYILVKNGVVIVSVPDMDGTLDWAADGQLEFALRHLRGSRRDEFNVHKSWWTRETLKEALDYSKFEVEWLENFHLYPALVIKGRKQ